jgi:DNA-binding MarR family transcriptional regulator
MVKHPLNFLCDNDYRDKCYLDLFIFLVNTNLIAIYIFLVNSFRRPFYPRIPAMDPHFTPLDDRLCFAIYSTSIAINRLYKPVLDEMGITYPQYLVLSALWEKDCQSIGAIADRLSLDSSTITPLVKRLELAGFLRRHRNAVDERQVHVHLTEKAQALKPRTSCFKDMVVAKSGMSMEEMGVLNKDIRRFLAALTEQEHPQAAELAYEI